MKKFWLVLLLCVFSNPAFAGACLQGAPGTLEEILQLKKAKDLHDEAEMRGLNLAEFQASACRKPGIRCTNSGQCCGASFCNDGVCSGSGNGICRGNGAACSSSAQCCGMSFCNNGSCSSGGGGICKNPGDACRASNECCGVHFCTDGACN